MTQALWTLDAMREATGGRTLGRAVPVISGISIDSRTARAGDAFFAIRGDTHDGHDFVNAALANGASLAVVDQARISAMPPGAPLLAVQDVLEALVTLGKAARARSTGRIIGVTGSVGKTSTKDALALVLSREGETHAAVASFNNHWGVPLTLARMPEAARFGVFEMGMNHAGEISPLTRMVRPHVAIITTIAPVHLENLGSIEAIADAKAEIFEGVEPGGAVVINRDVAQFAQLEQAARARGIDTVVSFGADAKADARLVGLSMQADCSYVSAVIMGDAIAYKVGAPGRHVVLNSLGVLAAARLAGADLALSGLALAHLTPPQGRGQRHVLDMRGGEAVLIDESYNANPVSMRAALALLGQTPAGERGRRIAVMGDMLELGPDAQVLHRDLAPAVVETGTDLVFASGPLMKAMFEALPADRQGAWRGSSAELQPLVLDALRAGDVVMVKGSNGSRMGPIVKALVAAHAASEAPRLKAAQG
jgi:UDP-N-acetylmuramoyl-tripeptide--D-alanyl-D-alanine ligase